MAEAPQHLAADDAYLDDVTPASVVVTEGEITLLAIAPLVTLPAVLAKRAIRAALRQVHPPYPGTSREVEAVLAVTMGTAPRRDLADGYIVEKRGPSRCDPSSYQPRATRTRRVAGTGARRIWQAHRDGDAG